MENQKIVNLLNGSDNDNSQFATIAVDLSKETDPQQSSFIGKLLRNTGATMLFIIEKSEKTTFNFSQNSVTII